MTKAVLQPRKTRATFHYINNDKMLEQIAPYRKAYVQAVKNDSEKPRIPEYIGECILQIATRLAQKPQFRSYSFVDEMIDDGIENCIQYAHNFDPAKSSYVFTYFTKMVFYAFVRRIQKEKKHSYIKHKVFEKYYMYDEFVQQSDNDRRSVENKSQLDYYNEHRAGFIEEYEGKQEDKKTKKAKKDAAKSKA